MVRFALNGCRKGAVLSRNQTSPPALKRRHRVWLRFSPTFSRHGTLRPSHQDLLGASLEETPCLVGRGLLKCCYSSGRKKRKHFSVTCAINKSKTLPYSMEGPLDGFLEFSKSLKENPRADCYSPRWQGSRQQKRRPVSK